MANILQAELLVDFLYPFLLMFFISFALLEKAQIFGEATKQINAFVSLVLGLIFVSAANYVGFASELVLFMTVGLIVIFVGLMLWGFITGGGFTLGKDGKLKIFFAIAIGISIIIAVIVASGIADSAWQFIEDAFDWMFHSGGSNGFWTNFLVVALIAVAVAAVLKNPVKGG